VDEASSRAGGRKHFCPQCGEATTADDRFCRNCGAPLRPRGQAQSHPSGSPSSDGASTRRGALRPILGGLALLLIAGGVAVGVLFATGVLETGGEDHRSGPSAAAVRAVAREMELRDEFYKAERAYLQALGSATTALKTYRRQDREFRATTKRIEEEFADEFDECFRFAAVPCPEPDYPDPPKVPDFDTQTREMRSASQDFAELQAELTAIKARPVIAALHIQLLSAVEAAKSEVDHNADVFDEAVQTPGEEMSGGIDRGKIKTLRRETALPAIRQMNLAAVRAVRRVGRSLRSYDLPGGRDLDPDDHSDEV
jgi:hypothetical protein